MQKGPIRKP